MTYGADADDESIEELRRVAMEENPEALPTSFSVTTAEDEAAKYEAEIANLKERFSAEQQRLEQQLLLSLLHLLHPTHLEDFA